MKMDALLETILVKGFVTQVFGPTQDLPYHCTHRCPHLPPFCIVRRPNLVLSNFVAVCIVHVEVNGEGRPSSSIIAAKSRVRLTRRRMVWCPASMTVGECWFNRQWIEYLHEYKILNVRIKKFIRITNQYFTKSQRGGKSVFQADILHHPQPNAKKRC